MRLPTPYYGPWTDFLALLKATTPPEPDTFQRNYSMVPLIPPGFFQPGNLLGMQATASYGPQVSAMGKYLADTQREVEAARERERAAGEEVAGLRSRMEPLLSRLSVPYKERQANWWELAIPALAMIVASPGKKGDVARAAAQYFGGVSGLDYNKWQTGQEQAAREYGLLSDRLAQALQQQRYTTEDIAGLRKDLQSTLLSKLGLEGEAQRAGMQAKLEEARLASAERRAREQERRQRDFEVGRLLRDQKVDEDYNRILMLDAPEEDRRAAWEQFIDSLVAFVQPVSSEDPEVLRATFARAFPLLPYGQLSLREQQRLQQIKSSQANEQLTLARLRRTEELLPYEITIYDERGKLLKKQVQWYDPLMTAKLKAAEMALAEARKRMQNIDSMIAARAAQRGTLKAMTISELAKAQMLFNRALDNTNDVVAALDVEEKNLRNQQFLYTKPGSAEYKLLQEQIDGVVEQKKEWQRKGQEAASWAEKVAGMVPRALPPLNPTDLKLRGPIEWHLLEE